MNLNVNSAQRLAIWRKSMGWTQREAAFQLGVSQGFVSDIENGRTEPSRNFLQKLSERFSVSATWILEGREPMVFDTLPGFVGRQSGSRIEPPNYAMPAHGDFTKDGEDYVMIDRYDLSVSAGNGLMAVEHGERERLAFSRTWLLRNGINSDLSVLVRVQGDSMIPTIPDGCLVLVHVVEVEVKKEGIYAYLRDGSSFVKRLIPINTGKDGRATSLVILSDNPAYPPDVLVGEALNEIRIVGRIRCAMTTF